MLRVPGRFCLGRIRYSSLSSRALLKGLTRPQPGLKFALPPEVQTTISRFRTTGLLTAGRNPGATERRAAG